MIKGSVLAAVWFFVTAGTAFSIEPLGSAFTFQGKLELNGSPVNDTCDCHFSLWDDQAAGTQVGQTLMFDEAGGMFPPISVDDGVLKAELDFGVAVFDGNARWLEIAVACPSGGTLEALTPRQPITAAPYALYAMGGPGSGGGFWAALGDHIYNTNTGRVGIGTTDPQAMLHIEGDGLPLVLAQNNWYAIRGTHESTTGTFPGVWGDTNSESSNATGLRGIVNSTTPGPGSTGVLGQNNGTGANGIGVRGTHAGSGIGVQGDVTGGAGLAGHFVGGRTRIENTFSFDTGGQLDLKGPASGISFTLGTLNFMDANDIVHGGVSYIRSIVGDRLIFRTADTDQVYVDQDGRTGIGIASPAVPLHVVGGSELSGRTGGTVIIGEVADVNLGLDTNELAARSDGDPSTLYLNQDGGDVAIAVNGPGGLGIGDATPEARLDVTTSNDQVAQFTQSGDHPGVVVTSLSASSPYPAMAVNGFSNVVPALTVTGEARVDGLSILGTGTEPALNVAGTARVEVLEIVGADVAERFPVSDEPKPGMVMEIDPDHAGKLRIARGAYNQRVAGVVSGANGLAAGTILGNLPGHEDAPPVALSGRVWTYCDATTRAIEIGDLLTTSDRPGHAMKVTEHTRATGTILGKAMTSLAKGETGLVLVLVNLQ